MVAEGVGWWECGGRVCVWGGGGGVGKVKRDGDLYPTANTMSSVTVTDYAQLLTERSRTVMSTPPTVKR